MDISVELTLSPLAEDFETPIIAFIKTLRASEFKVIETPLSTQIFGDYDTLMPFLTAEIKKTFSAPHIMVLHLKLVTTNRGDYTPFF